MVFKIPWLYFLFIRHIHAITLYEGVVTQDDDDADESDDDDDDDIADEVNDDDEC